MTSAGAIRARPLRSDAEVLENRCEGGRNHRLRLRVPGWPGAEPGQFVMLSAGARSEVERTDPLLPRPMAIYRGHAPASGGALEAEIEVLYRVAGRGTKLIGEALVGQRLRVVGPLGSGFPSLARNSRVILVAGGTGVASLWELARRCVETARTSLILGARSSRDLMGRADFATLDLDLRLTTEDGSEGQRGRVTDALGPILEALPDATGTTLCACGPTPMMRACWGLAVQRGVRCLVSLENNMACGFGVCLGCAIPRRGGDYGLVCRSGPVFDAAEVDWERLP